MGEDYQRRTRDTLGKIIKKPPLTDKLLTKPPFRFLHDITTEVIRTTGFLNGLFSAEDMDSRNVSVKEDKMKFLQKIIDVVMIVTGEQLTVKPSKVVAGHEPEKTNELLQAIAKCINRNLSSDDAVQQVLSGKKSSKVQEKPPSGASKRREKPHDQRRSKRDPDENESERERSRDRRRRSAGRERRDESRENEEGAGEGNEEREQRRHRETSQDKDKSRDHSSERKEEKRERRESKPMMKDFRHQGMSKSSNRASSAVKPSRSSTSQEKKAKQPVKAKKSKEKLAKDAVSNDKQKLKKKRDEEQQQREEANSADSRMKEEEQEERMKSANANEGGTEKPSGRPPRPASAKGHRRRPADKSTRGQDPDMSRTSAHERSSRPARPPSARPAAPRVRKKPDPAEEEIARMESAGRNRTAPLIIDRGSHKDDGGLSSSDEDEQFLVQEENDIDPPDLGKLSPLDNRDTNGEVEDDEHGGLVRKILETKKELETSASKGANVAGKRRTEIERTPVNEAQRRKERELVMRDIEKLRSSVQKLCRSAVPLGKIIDYIQEDMDSMQNEVLQWKKENKEHVAKLLKEDSITTETIKPLQAQLDELDRSIAAHMDMIAASKCNVIRNQEKIDKMISGVTAKS